MSDAFGHRPILEGFPAAHSMDTTWFAVDQYGHVAKFDTGEAGSMPTIAQTTPDQPELTEALANSGTAGITFYCDDLFSEADGKLYWRPRPWELRWTEVAKDPREPEANWIYAGTYLVWLRDEEALANLAGDLQRMEVSPRPTRKKRNSTPAPTPTKSEWKILRLPAADKVVAWLSNESGNSTAASIRDLLARGILCRAWMYDWKLEVERFGIFGYEMNQFQNWIAGPFEKTGNPPHLLRSDMLPPNFRSVAEACWLERVDFQRDALVQPFEHGTARCVSETWISTTGQRHLTTEFGPEVAGIVDYPPSPPQLRSTIVRASTLVSLLSAYLNLEPGSTEVLSDYLEEAGQERMAGADTTADRFDEILLRFFTPDERLRLEADFVEHLLITQRGGESAPQVIRTGIETARQYAAGLATAEALDDAARAAFGAWVPPDEYEGNSTHDENEQEWSRVAWATWALARQMPLVAARTARSLDRNEFAWQIEWSLSRIRGNVD